VAESRSGIVRNAQGLNPDTLHDTAKGALALITAAQKRVRLIARIFAETGVKDLFLGVHALLRSGYSRRGQDLRQPDLQARQRSGRTMRAGQLPAALTPWPCMWASARPASEHDMMVAQQRLELMNNVMQMPGVGQMVTLTDGNVHNALSAWERAAGTKDAGPLLDRPEARQAKPRRSSTRSSQNPEMAKAQAAATAAAGAGPGRRTAGPREGAVRRAACRRRSIRTTLKASAVQGQRDHELKMAQLQAETSLKRWQVEQELELKRESLAAELAMKREVALLQARSSHEVGMAKVEASVQQPEPGGEPG
jgi:hypothetical protein